MVRPLSLAEHTLFAELIEQSLDRMFSDQFSENGSFTQRKTTNREGVTRSYWYYQGYRPAAGPADKAARFSRYVGPVDDPAITRRVEDFQAVKAARADRGSIVGALVGAGLPRPPIVMGRIIEALAKAGLFRLRAVLIGSAAFQTYSGVLGARLDKTAVLTKDVDVAQFRSISIGVDDTIPDVLETLRGVDPTFRPVGGLKATEKTTSFEGQAFRVDFLTPHRGGDEQMGAPMDMPALGGAGAQPLRFMDYLIHDPVRSVVLHGPGISVNVPAPERYAIHKLMMPGLRHDDSVARIKAGKDIVQAAELIEGLVFASRERTLDAAFEEAWDRGRRWRTLLQDGLSKLPDSARSALEPVWNACRTRTSAPARTASGRHPRQGVERE